MEKNAIPRIELTVQVRNKQAIYLYRSAGFIVEGTRKQALVIDDE